MYLTQEFAPIHWGCRPTKDKNEGKTESHRNELQVTHTWANSSFTKYGSFRHMSSPCKEVNQNVKSKPRCNLKNLRNWRATLSTEPSRNQEAGYLKETAGQNLDCVICQWHSCWLRLNQTQMPPLKCLSRTFWLVIWRHFTTADSIHTSSSMQTTSLGMSQRVLG